MAKTKEKNIKNNSFFEEEEHIKETPKATPPFNASNSFKNTLYKYKDGVNCRVVYDLSLIHI